MSEAEMTSLRWMSASIDIGSACFSEPDFLLQTTQPTRIFLHKLKTIVRSVPSRRRIHHPAAVRHVRDRAFPLVDPVVRAPEELAFFSASSCV